jgi:hypothetical protein
VRCDLYDGDRLEALLFQQPFQRRQKTVAGLLGPGLDSWFGADGHGSSMKAKMIHIHIIWQSQAKAGLSGCGHSVCIWIRVMRLAD